MYELIKEDLDQVVMLLGRAPQNLLQIAGHLMQHGSLAKLPRDESHAVERQYTKQVLTALENVKRVEFLRGPMIWRLPASTPMEPAPTEAPKSGSPLSSWYGKSSRKRSVQ